MSQEIVFCQFESDHDREGMLVWELFGEEIAWYADGETILRNEYNPSIAYAYGIICKTDIYG